MKKKKFETQIPIFAFILMTFIVIQFFLVRFVKLPTTAFERLQITDTSFLDCFQYARSVNVVGFGILLILWLLSELLTKPMLKKLVTSQKILIGLAVISLLAAVLSPYREQVISGAEDNYQGIGVQLAYLCIALSVSWAVASDKRMQELFLSTAGPIAAVLLAIASVVGIPQYYGFNLLETPIFRALEAPAFLASEQALFTNTGMAFSFFGNPNYVASAFVLFVPFVIHQYMGTQGRRAYLYLIVIAAALYTTLCAQSLGGVIFLPVTVLLMLGLYMREPSVVVKRITAIAVTVVAVNMLFILQSIQRSQISGVKEVGFSTCIFIVGCAGLWAFRVFGKKAAWVFGSAGIALALAGLIILPGVLDSRDPLLLKSVTIDPETIRIETQTISLLAKFNKGAIAITDTAGEPIETQQSENSYSLTAPGYQGITYTLKPARPYPVFQIKPFNFPVVITEKGFQYINGGGLLDTLAPYASFVPQKWDHIGTGRLYIWSEAVGLIGKAPLLGYGPDTFSLAFPQNDVVGKYNAIQNASIRVDKTHNMYLQGAFEFGIPYLIGFLLLNGMVLRNGYAADYENRFRWIPFTAAIAGFLLMGIANDTKVYTASFYWVVMGASIGLSTGWTRTGLPEATRKKGG